LSERWGEKSYGHTVWVQPLWHAGRRHGLSTLTPPRRTNVTSPRIRALALVRGSLNPALGLSGRINPKARDDGVADAPKRRAIRLGEEHHHVRYGNTQSALQFLWLFSTPLRTGRWRS
jgi:hypothetical protein